MTFLSIIARNVIKTFYEVGLDLRVHSVQAPVTGGLGQCTSHSCGWRAYGSMRRGFRVSTLLNRVSPFTGTWTVSDPNKVSG
jgi:hypothetical protein